MEAKKFFYIWFGERSTAVLTEWAKLNGYYDNYHVKTEEEYLRIIGSASEFMIDRIKINRDKDNTPN